MATITAALVKELRDKTDAGMMDCKAALTATDGDMDAAVDWLRTKGLSKAAKKAGRVAAEGLVGIVGSATSAAVVEVNSETDFVARNEQFQGLVKMIAQVALKTGGDVAAINAATVGSSTVAEAVASTIATIGENMNLRRATVLSVGQGVVGHYLHNQITDGLGKIGVLVALESAGKADELGTLARQIAMHVAATNPAGLDLASVPGDVLEREKAILMEKNAGKPAHVLEKIVESGMKSYAKENCLLEQAFIHDGSKSVTQVLKEAEGKAGAPVVLKAYVRYALGEGIEKVENDFAAEVAAQAGIKA
jgi:elongation factor Ts